MKPAATGYSIMRIQNPNPHGPLRESKLNAFEKALGVRLPNQYREFLICANGGRWENRVFRISEEEGESEVHHVFGLHDGPDFCRLDRAWEIVRERIPASLIPIADDPGGNKICLGIRGDRRGKVFFWAHEWGSDHRGHAVQKYTLIEISGSFASFVQGLKKQSDSVDQDEIEEIIKRDDRDAIAKLVENGALDIEAEDSHGRTPVERATIAASPNIINYLLEKGARLRASLELARTNAEYFEEHRPIVSLLERFQKTIKRSE